MGGRESCKQKVQACLKIRNWEQAGQPLSNAKQVCCCRIGQWSLDGDEATWLAVKEIESGGPKGCVLLLFEARTDDADVENL